MVWTAKQITGQWGEEQATLFLVEQGYKIVNRNYRVKQGEIDIIAWQGGTLCFVEVKTREEDDGSAERATASYKMQKIFRAAKMYCLENNIPTEKIPIQFEQVSVYKKGPRRFNHQVIFVD